MAAELPQQVVSQIQLSANWSTACWTIRRHAPSIGLLYKTQNKVIAECALRGVDKPLGIAAYALADALPDELEGQLPSVEALEKELGRMGRGEDE